VRAGCHGQPVAMAVVGTPTSTRSSGAGPSAMPTRR
jgi:hypothetical protein